MVPAGGIKEPRRRGVTHYSNFEFSTFRNRTVSVHFSPLHVSHFVHFVKTESSETLAARCVAGGERGRGAHVSGGFKYSYNVRENGKTLRGLTGNPYKGFHKPGRGSALVAAEEPALNINDDLHIHLHIRQGHTEISRANLFC